MTSIDDRSPCPVAAVSGGVVEHEAHDLEPEDDSAWQRYIDALQAIEAARPTDLAGLAVQVSVIADHLATAHGDEHVGRCAARRRAADGAGRAEPHHLS